MTEIEKLVQGILAGDKRSIARAITIIENNGQKAQKIISAIYPYTGRAYVIGIKEIFGPGTPTDVIVKFVKENAPKRA